VTALLKLWRDHSLTIVCWISGAVAMALALLLEHDSKQWDVAVGLAHGLLTVALFYTLAGTLTERNKPEEPT
jgi:hypothetical protein